MSLVGRLLPRCLGNGLNAYSAHLYFHLRQFSEILPCYFSGPSGLGLCILTPEI